MPYPAGNIAATLASRRRGLDAYLQRIQESRANGTLTDHDVTRAYRGSFVEFYLSYENAIERLFIGTMQERITYHDGSIRSLARVSSDKVARRIAFDGRQYADWIPFSYTAKRAKIYLSRGLPFDAVSKDDAKFIDRMGLIRNAIAHDSGAALRRFRDEVIGATALPPSQRRPGPYLRGQHTFGVTRYRYLTTRAEAILTSICAH